MQAEVSALRFDYLVYSEDNLEILIREAKRRLRFELQPLYRNNEIAYSVMELQVHQFERKLRLEWTDPKMHSSQRAILRNKISADIDSLLDTEWSKKSKRGYRASNIKKYERQLKIRQTWKPSRLRNIFSKLQMLGIAVLSFDVLNRIYNLTLGDLDDLTLIEKLILPQEGLMGVLEDVAMPDDESETAEEAAALANQFASEESEEM